MSQLFVSFLQLIGVGAVLVFGLFLVIRFGLPNRSTTNASRRIH